MSAEKLYSPALLAAAVELAAIPPLDNAAFLAEARSPACGSTLAISIRCDDHGAIQSVGMQVRACAVGQAAAAVFARHARLRSPADIERAHDAMAAWLQADAPMPDWPDLELIAPAANFPGRHGAMLLPWKAARDALSTQTASS